ncbi:hypothetical protein [Accumulibacter sp.]|uniref:hypothetical protein n=1 Tax=Accumulibacter sp. TaxID=2053492 RepID=UPI002C0018FD|nr:hypothetical protein [Accumulibacter sp.]HNG17191.1 hypothetical protein [Accumulibacter sp.]
MIIPPAKAISSSDHAHQVATALGLVADSRVKLILCVEGPTDVTALKALSRALHQEDPTLPDLHIDRRVAFAVLGGSTLQHWVTSHYLRDLGLPEIHIYDGDVAAYAAHVAAVNARTDGSWAVQTTKHEIESYLHADAIHEALGVVITVPDQLDPAGHAVPRLVALALFALNPVGAPMSDTKIKKRLADQAFARMTAQRLAARDPAGEVETWMRRVAAML